MLLLNLPHYPIKMIQKDNKSFIWDIIRRKYVSLTSEEWVRQQFILYLLREKQYPSSLIANEVSITLNSTKRRCDTVVYDNTLHPLLIIEYKSAKININQNVFNQIVRYNSVLKVPYLIVTNGIHHFCCFNNYKERNYCFLDEIPTYCEIIASTK